MVMRRWAGREVDTWQAVRAILVRTVLFAVAWWAVAEGRPVGWLFALAGIGGASLLSLRLLPPGNWTLVGVALFVPFFLLASVRGGVDVAWRALAPGGHIAPGWVEHVFETDDPDVRLLVANALSLTPGTLSARLDEDRVVVHVLDVDSGAVRVPGIVEQRATATTRRYR
jgi:multicomponent Na+:H+ antiporter subunit E